MTTAKSGEKGEARSFEKSLARLESIVAEMESGALSLDRMMERFEEGQKLVDFCAGKLNEVERKIEILVKKGEKTATEPFEELKPPAKKVSKGDAGTDELF